MKTSVDVKEFKAALDLVKPCVSTKRHIATLGGVRLEVTPVGLVVDGTDLDARASVSIPCEIGTPGSVIVPLRQLQTVVKTAKGQLELELVDDQLAAVNGARSLLPTLSADDWPRDHDLTGTEAEIDSVDLEILRGIALAASDDPEKPFLTGVCLTGTHAVATDAYRLHFTEFELSGLAEPAIVPASYIDAILKAQKKLKTPLHMRIATSEFHRYAVFGCGPATWRLGLIEGQFPNWQNLVPERATFTATFERESLLTAVTALLTAVGREPLVPIRMLFSSEGTAHLSVKVADAIATETTVPCVTAGELLSPPAGQGQEAKPYEGPPRVGLNPAFFRDCILAGTGPVRLEMLDPHKVAAIRDDGPITRLIMPVKIP